MIIDGKAIAARIRAEVAEEVKRLPQRPGLALVRVGNDPASEIYVRVKVKACAETGIQGFEHILPEQTRQDELLRLVGKLNGDRAVHGVLVQLPLPKQIDTTQVIEEIAPGKDVDGFHPYNLGRLAQRLPVLRPCTPYGVIELLKSTGEVFKGRTAVVVGASNHVGRPMMLELMLAGATANCCHRFTRDVAGEVARADIVVVAVGKPQFVKGAWIKPGATVIDIGINRTDDGKLVGDVEFEAARQRAAWITPVPGGVGPMTVAMLMHNTLLAAQLREAAP